MKFYLLAFTLFSTFFISCANKNALVLQTDFGLKDGAVSAMYGVAFNVDKNIPIYSLTHEIPAYNIWEGSYRLMQTIEYWPKGTVFVSVVDPGVGTDRKSVVAKTKTGKYIVTPDNGTLTLVEDAFGIEELRQIDEKINRLSNSYDSYTFHGRDVYVYTASRLASGAISFEEVGPLLENKILKLPYQKASIVESKLSGNIPVLDIQYGNVWTNITKDLWEKEFSAKKGNVYKVAIFNGKEKIYEGKAPYVNTFGEVAEGETMLYLNSLLNLSIAINWGDFAKKYKVSSGADWSILITK